MKENLIDLEKIIKYGYRYLWLSCEMFLPKHREVNYFYYVRPHPLCLSIDQTLTSVDRYWPIIDFFSNDIFLFKPIVLMWIPNMRSIIPFKAPKWQKIYIKYSLAIENIFHLIFRVATKYKKRVSFLENKFFFFFFRKLFYFFSLSKQTLE